MKLLRVVPILSFALAACGSSEPTGLIAAVVQAQTSNAQVTRVTVTITPANVVADLTRDPGGTFSGLITVPVGTQTVRADAFAGATLVATGSTSATVTKGKTVNVQLTILDSTGPGPLPDHSPVVTSLVAPAAAQVGDQLTLSATAMDADGDTMTFAWVASPAGCGTFSSTTTLTTTLTAQTVSNCHVTFTVTARGKSDNKSADIAVAVGTGTVSVVVTYVPQPLIDSIAFSSGASQIALVNRTDLDATIRAAFHKGTAYTVTITFEPAADGALDLQDTCSGTIVQPVFVANATSATATWTPTVNSGACIVTAQLTRRTLVDGFPVVVLPVP